MAQQECLDHPSELCEGEGCATGPVTKLLERGAECLEAVQKMTSRKFNNEQCQYLADKLQVVLQSANSFVEVCPAELHGHGKPSDDTARIVEIFKLLFALAKAIQSFIGGCCEDGWLQAAMTLTNVSAYVSSLGFNLELCRAVLGQEYAARGCLTMDQVAEIHADEVEVVKQKALGDWDTLVAKVIHSLTEKSLSSEENDLAAYLLQRLHRVKAIPRSASSRSSWWDIAGDEGSVVGNLYKWVKPLERLGKGATGTVHKAMWLGTPVAKKTFSGRTNQDFKREVEILAGLCHPNVTSMFCCAEHSHSCSIVMELMDEDLHDLMQRRCESRWDGSNDAPPFTILEAIDIMLQVGEGVNYLHNQVTPSIVHRDLKSSNILVRYIGGGEGEVGYVHAKVTDFGLSKTKDCSTRYTQQSFNTGTNRWMAPEVIYLHGESEGSTSMSGRVPSYPLKCDVYSFGMVCFEILSGHEPFPNESLTAVKKKVLRGERPDIPYHCPMELKVLIEECWSQEPKKRPSFDVICSKLMYLKYLLMTGFSSKSCGVGYTESQFHREEVEIQEYIPRFVTDRSFSFGTEGGKRFRLTGSCSLVLHLGDITEWWKDGKTDAIVNSANEGMLGGGGVNGAIHSAAGMSLSNACLQVPEVSRGVRCPVGSAVITPGFNLPVSRVIHTVGPRYWKVKKDSASLLASAYKNSVGLAVKNRVKYVAFPAISCGFYRYPSNAAAEVSIQALQESAGQLLEVHFFLLEAEVYSAWFWQAEKKLERLSNILVKPKVAAPIPVGARTASYSGTRVRASLREAGSGYRSWRNWCL